MNPYHTAHCVRSVYHIIWYSVTLLCEEKTKSFVETMYGFESGRSKKAIAANRKLAEELKRFIYEVGLYYSFDYSA